MRFVSLSFALILILTLVSCNGSPTEPFGRVIEGARSSLSGTVRDAGGHPTQGMNIGIVTPEGGVAGSAVSGENGRYSITRLNPGRYRVWARLGRIDNGRFVADIELREGPNTFDFVR